MKTKIFRGIFLGFSTPIFCSDWLTGWRSLISCRDGWLLLLFKDSAWLRERLSKKPLLKFITDIQIHFLFHVKNISQNFIQSIEKKLTLTKAKFFLRKYVGNNRKNLEFHSHLIFPRKYVGKNRKNWVLSQFLQYFSDFLKILKHCGLERIFPDKLRICYPVNIARQGP